MTTHIMKLKPSPFNKIKDGYKTIELRLYDEKRRMINIGDTIQFVQLETKETLDVIVEDIYIFDTFKDLYENLELLECGYTQETIMNASYKDMELYYPLEKQLQYKVIGIKIKLK